MKLLWISWKDIKNPIAGGAEVVTDNLLKRFVADGNEAILLTSSFSGAKKEENINGYRVIRVGGRWSVYWHAYKYYEANLKNWADIVIEEINTIPFFSQCYLGKERRFLFFHQLCREIWFFQMFFPLSLIGYLVEPIYLWLLKKNNVITISESTRSDLVRYGFEKENVSIISEGIEIKPVTDLKKIEKFKDPTLLSLGAIRDMKRTIDQVKAFEIAKKTIPELKMKIAGGGSGKYFEQFKVTISNSPYKNDIDYLGRVSEKQKIELMQKSHVIAVTSVKEGWGLIVTEANSQGTPAVVYNVSGLRDSTQNGKTGLVSEENSPKSLADSICSIFKDKSKYREFREAGWEWSKKVTFSKCFSDFINALEKK